tara:strand:- start:2359 stop:3213 length:855 start_codon:yes stop_codon:yes gene_type:complete
MATRNNKDRLAGPGASTTASAEMTTPNLMDFVVPTEFVELPSGGQFYPQDHPLSGENSIEIRFMTAKDEDTLTSKTLLKQGVALDRVLQNLIVDKTINIKDLLIGDKNAIIVASRSSAYGANYETKVTCPACVTTVEQTFDLSEVKLAGPYDLEDLGVTKNDDGTFSILLPITKVEATVKLMTGHDESKLNILRGKKNKVTKDEDLSMTDQFKQFIVSINGVTDKNQVSSFIENMPANDSRFLRLAYKKIVPNLDMNQDFECESCGYQQEMEVPFTTDFFWPKL